MTWEIATRIYNSILISIIGTKLATKSRKTNLSSKVLEDGSWVDSRGGSNAASSKVTALKMSVQTTDGEL